MIIATPRMRLRCWEDTDRDAFATMHADPAVMHDYGGPISREESDAKLDRYAMAYRQQASAVGQSKAEKVRFSATLASCLRDPVHPIGPHIEVGWRLVRHAWGHGYATEAARAALDDALLRIGLSEAVTYTAPDNLRSQAAMTRLRLERDPSRDFTADYDGLKA